jgi:GNAT superfamily N-acetyltransferase
MVLTELRIEKCSEEHPNWSQFLKCLHAVEPEQAQFVLGPYSKRLPCQLFIAVHEGDVVGFLRFGIQPIGSEEGASPIVLDGQCVCEAKIHAFAVRPEFRRQGIGARLQHVAIDAAREAGCHQLSSHTGSHREENCRLKLKLGFAAVVDQHERRASIRFVMPLK